MGCRVQELDAWISSEEAIGDIFEVAVAIMFCKADYNCILDLVEFCFWEGYKYESGEEVADEKLRLAREWLPEHGTRSGAEGMPSSRKKR